MGPAGLADAGMGPIAIYWQQSLEMRMKCVLGAGVRKKGVFTLGHTGAVRTCRRDIR